MIKIQLTAPINMLHDALKCLVDSNTIHLIDQHPEIPAFQRRYFSLLSKTQELQTKFTNIRTQIEVNKKVQIPVQIENSQFNNMQSLERYLDITNQELKQVSQDLQSHRKTENVLLGKYLALKNVDKIIDKQMFQTTRQTDMEVVDSLQTLVFISPKSLTLPIMKSMYSVTQSNIQFQVQELEEQVDGQQIDLLVGFVAGNVSYEKCKKVLQSFGIQLVEIQDNYDQQLQVVQEQLENIRKTINYVQLTQIKILEDCSAYIDYIDNILETEKSIINAMNQFEFSDINAKIFAWVPSKRYERFEQIIQLCNQQYINLGQVEVIKIDYDYKKENPPTFFVLSHLTESFHYLVTAYGTPCYKEINPALFYLFHFNFTFALMFGDVCHGIINALAALAFIIFSKKLSKNTSDIIQLLYTGRYLILAMSIFSILVGFVYNDYFALAFNVFDTQYTWQGQNKKYIGVWPDDDKPHLSKYGIDAFWHWANNNSMIFLNSYKMKLSVVIGITQMLIGVFLKLLNCIYYKDYKKIICVWIPELLFLGGFFGYMVFCIIYKWLQYWPEGSNPPSLINLLIAIFLSPGTVDPVNQLFNDINKQQQVQMFIFAITIISLLWMIISSPIWTIIHLKRHPEEQKPNMADMWVSTIIGCIEYVLGCISHTASYLRLWALSLSHSQLAEIFFDELIGISLNLDFNYDWQGVVYGGLTLIITYAAWFGCTIAILCLMECLSAFLHALRLVWIEFNNKFFVAEGYPFQPLDLPEGRFTIEQTSQMAREE